MKVFVTGASGFVGQAVVAQLIAAGHQVTGLARSNAAAATIAALGGQILQGDATDVAVLAQGAGAAEGVIHCAFNHDFSRFLESCAEEERAVMALGTALEGTAKKLIVTSGQMAASEDLGPQMQHPRVVSENAVTALRERGIKAMAIRLPPSVHGAGEKGFVPMLIDIALDKGLSVYLGEGANLWPAVHRSDAAQLYRLMLEQGEAPRYHAAAESGVPFRDIAAAIGKGLGLPVKSLPADQAEAHFGSFARFAAIDVQASSLWTQSTLGYRPTGPGLLEDIAAHYF